MGETLKTALTEAEIDVKVQAAKDEDQAFALDVGALKAIYQHVWDKGLLGVSEEKYGKLLADLYDECQVTGNVARQQKVKVGAPWVAPRFGTDSYVGQAAKCSQGQGRLFQVDGSQRSRRHGEQAEDLGREVGRDHRGQGGAREGWSLHQSRVGGGLFLPRS
jgi:hypothetical protein